MWQLSLLLTRLLLVIILAAGAVHGKHWRRAPVHGAFDVDAYAYNKPVGKLLGQEQTAPVMPMAKLLEQLSQSSRSVLAVAKLKAQYRHLEDKFVEAEDEDDAEEETSASGTIINKRLAELARDNLYSHEFLVQTKGKKKFVQLNTLSRPGPGEAHKPETPEVMAETQTQPLNVKLALPELPEEDDEDEEQWQEEKNDPVKQQQDEQVELNVNQNASTSEPKYTEAISTMQQMETKLTSEAIGKQQKQQQDANADSMPVGGVKDAQNMATIEAPNAANAAGKPKGQQEMQEKEKPKEQTEQEHKPSHQISSAAISAASSSAAAPAAAATDDDDDAKQSDSRPDNDGQVNGMNVAPTAAAAAESVGGAVGTPVGAAVGATSDKPLSLSLSPAKSKRKQTQRQTQAQAQTQTKQKTKTKTKPANEIDTKPTSASNVGQRVQGMSGANHAASATNVKAPAKESPEISQQDIRRPVQKVKGNGMDMLGTMAKGKGKGKRQGQGQGQGQSKRRKGAQRRPSEEQEIETTTNWWHILPYAEIRKFLNTIYDSITDEDDDERAQRI